MPKDNKSKNNIDFLKLFKKSLAMSLTVCIFGIQTSYATNITAGSGYGTNVETSGNTTNITGGLLNGDTGFHHFTDFNLSANDIANLIFLQGANRYVNLVDSQVGIYGIFNSIKGGAIGGDVIFVSPLGMIVGSSGIMNVGSLQTITPASGTYNSLVGLGTGISYDNIRNLSSDGSTASVNIQGKIFASDNIDLSAGTNVLISPNATLVTGFNQDGFNKTRLPNVDMSEIVNDEGIVSADFISNTGGDIKLFANNVNATGGLIQSNGDVAVDARDGTITLGSKVMSGGDVNIGANSSTTTRRVTLNNDITADGNVNITIERDVVQNESSNITASGVNYAASTLTLDGNVTSSNGINISSTEFNQGSNSEILNTDSGNIIISASTDIESNKITNQSQNGLINLSGREIVLKDTVASSGTINVSAQGDISQADDSFNAFDSGNDLNITADYNVGSSAQALNVNVDNNVNVYGAGSDVYLKSNDSDLNIATISNAQKVNLDGSKKINVSQSIDATDSVSISSKEGFSQTSDSSINILGASGDVTITNSGSGNVDINNISNYGGNISINNNSGSITPPTPGNVSVNGSVHSETGYVDIASDGGYSQSGVITANGSNNSGSSVVINAQGDAAIGQITGQNSVEISGNDITLNNLISSQNGVINLDAQGSIAQSSSDLTLSALQDVSLNAGADIGSADQTVVVSSANGEIIATAAGGVNLTGQNTNVDLADITAGTDYNIITTGGGEILFNKDLSNVNGSLSLITDSDMNINSAITALGDVTLVSNQGDIILNSLISSTEESVNLTAQGGIYHESTYTDVSISAQKDINLSAQTGDIGTFAGSSVSQTVKVNANGTVNIEGANVALESPNSLNIGNINALKENPQTLVNIKTTDGQNGNINFAGLIKGSDINVDSAQNITQSVDGQTIIASGDLSLISQGGNIGETDNAVIFTSDNISATAQSGSVILKGIDTDIKTSQISARDNIDLSTENTGIDPEKGKIIIENDLMTQDGYISLDSAKNLEINNNISAGQSITLNAQNGITQADNTVISSGNSASAGEGDGNILISNADSGDIVLGEVTANKGEISVVNNALDRDIVLNSVLNSTSSDVILNSEGDIRQFAARDNASIVAAGDIILNAVNAGAVDNKMMVNAGGALYSASDNLYVQDTDGDLTLGVLNIGQSADIAANGSILQDGQDRDAIVSSGTININTASGNIGSVDNSLALNLTGNGRVNAAANDIYLGGSGVSTGQINAVNNLNINTVDKNGSVTIADNLAAGGNIDITSGSGVSHTGGIISRNEGANSGYINIGATNGTISLGNVVNNNGEINITGTDNASDVILKNTIQSVGGNVTVSTVGDIVQNGTSPSIITDSNILLSSSGGSIGTGTGQGIVVQALNGSVSANADGSVYLVADNTNINASGVSAGQNIDLTVTGTGNINIDSSLETNNGYISLVTDNGIVIDNLVSATDDVTINALNGSITQNSSLDKAINADGDVNLSATGNIGADGEYLSLTSNGSVSADGQNIYLKSPDSDLNIASIDSDGVVNLRTDTAGNINLGGLVAGTDVTLDAANGIYQTVNGKTIDATGDLSLTAGQDSVGRQGQAISFSANSVSANAARSVVLLGEDTDINTSSIQATENIDLTTRVTDPESEKGVITVSNELNTTNGYIKLDSAKALNLNENISAGQHITLNANGGIVQTPGASVTSGTSSSAQNADINISNSGSGKIELSDVSSANGNINITNNVTSGEDADVILGDISAVNGAVSIVNSASDNDVILNSLVQSTGNNSGISITSNGALLQSHDNLALDTSGNIVIDTVNGAGTGFQSLKLGADGTLTASGNGIHITAPEKNLNIASISSTGDVNLTTENSGTNINIQGGITGNNINLNAQNGIYQTTDGKTITASGDLNLQAQEGDIGTRDNAITFESETVTASAVQGSVVLNGIDTTINTGTITAGQNIDLATTGSGNINVEDEINASGYVRLDSAESLTLNHNIISDSYIELGAVEGLTLNSNIEAETDVKIDTNGGVSQISGRITTNTGSVSVQNAETGNIDLNSISSSQNIDVTNSSAEGTVSLSGATAEKGVVNVSSQGNVTADGVTANGNIDIASVSGSLIDADSLTSQTGSVYLTSSEDVDAYDITASKDININNSAGNGSVIADTLLSQGGNIILNSSNSTTANNFTAAGNVEISNTTGTITAGEITSQTGYIDIDSAGTLTVTESGLRAEGGNITLNADDNITANNAFAAGNVEISNTTGTITAGEITSQTGHIDIDSAGTLTVTESGLRAEGGNITLNADDNITANNAFAAGNVEISNTTGTITAGEIISQGGNIVFDSAGNLTIDDGLTAQTGNIELTSNGDVMLSALAEASLGSVSITSSGSVSQNINGKTIQAGTDINIDAVNDIGQSNNALQINAGGTLNADADNIYITNNEGGLNIGEITAQNNANLTAAGNISQALPSSSVTAGNINLNADGYRIGAAGNALNVNTSNAVNAKADDIYLTSSNNLTAGRIDAQNTADITTTGQNTNITVSNLISGNDVNLNAAGSILQNSTLDKTIEAGNLNLTAQNGSIGETGNAIDFTATGNLQANASEAVVLNSVGRDLNTSSVTAGTSIDLSTEGSGKITVSSDLNAQGGYIRLDSAEALELNHDLTATDYIELSSKGGDVTLENSQISAGTYVDVDSFGSISQTGSLINAVTDIILNAEQSIGTAGNAIAVNAGNDVTVENAVNVFLNSMDTLNIAGVNASGTVNLAAATAGDVNIRGEIKGGDITVSATDNIYQSMEGQSVTATGDVILNAASGNIGQTGNAINIGAESISAAATSGSIVINGIDTDLNTNDITAGQNIDLTTTGSGDINVQSNLDANGYIRLDSSNNLNLGQYDVTSDDYIYLGANNGITLDSDIQAQTGVTVSSGAGILQNSGYVNSAAGDISFTNNGAGGINLNDVDAQGGSVTVNALQNASGNITLDNILANNSISVTNNSSVQSNVNLDDLTAVNGNISVTNTSGGNIALDSVLTAQNGTISINSGSGNIAQSHTNASVVSGGDVTLAGNNVGSQTQYINTQASGNVNADGTNIYIESNQDNYKIGNINSGSSYTNSTVNIKSNNGAVVFNGLVKGNAVDVDAQGSITQNSALDKSVEANTITFNTQNGSVGSSDNRIDMSVTGAVNVENADSVYLHGVDNGTDVAVNLGNITAVDTVDVTSETGMRLNGLIDTKDAILNAQGDILQSADTDLSIDADSIRLESIGGNIGTTGNAIDFKTTDLQAAALNGGVVLNGVDSSINTSTIDAGTNIDLSTTGSGDITIHDALTANGYIRLSAANSLNANHNLTAQDYIELAAQNGEVTLDSVIRGTDVTVSATGGVSQISGQILSSGTNGVNITNSQGGGINVTDIQATGGQINITNDSTASGDVLVDDISALNGVNITNNSSTSALVSVNKISNTNNSVDITNTSGGNVVLNNLVESSNGDVNIDASTGDITQTFDGVSISGADISLTAGNTVGTAQQSVLMNASGNVSLESSNLYITTPDSDLNIVSINQNRQDKTLGVVDLQTLTGNLSINDNITADDIDLVSAGSLSTFGNLSADDITITAVNAVTSAGNISGQNGVSISGGSVSQAENTTISSESGAVSITAQSGEASLSNVNGYSDITISGNSVSQNANNSISSETGSIFIAALNGDAELANVDGHLDITISGNSVSQAENTTVSSESGAVSITAQSGEASLSNVNGYSDVTISGNSVSQAENTTVSSESGAVSITAQSGEASLSNVNGYSDITISGNSVSQNANNSISSETGSIFITALNGDAELANVDGHLDITISGNSVSQAENTTISSESGAVSITAQSGEASLSNVNGYSDVTISGNSVSQAENTTISSESGAVSITAQSGEASLSNVNGYSNVTISGNSISQSADTLISSETGNVSITAYNGDVTLNGSLESDTGNVSVSNNSSADGSVTVNNVSAGNSYTIANNANGLLTVNGTLTGNNDSLINAQNTGSNSGLIISDTAVINNNSGALSIYNAGDRGMTLGGTINNSQTDGSSVTIVSERGGLNLSSDINNGANTGSTNTVRILNSGVDAEGNGLVFDSGTINNYGNLTVQNDAGEMSLAGEINTYLGSVNSFINGADSDFYINSDLENTGTSITFENRGTGNLIVGENANLSVYSTQQGDNVYTGVLNLVNTSATGNGGGITIDGTLNNGDGQTAGGIINITNDVNGGASDTGILLSDSSVINNYAELNITNNNTSGNASGSIVLNGTIQGDRGPILHSETAPVPAGSVINITNNASGANSSVEFGANSKTEVNGNVLNVTNNGQAGITLNENASVTNSANMTVTNNRGNLNIEDGAVVSSSSNLTISNTEAGNSVNINGQIHGANVTLNSTGSDVNIAHNTDTGNITADNNVNITVSNGDIVNTSASQNQQSKGISAGGNIVLNADNIGRIDSIDVVNDGYSNLNPDNAVHVNAGGRITANAAGDINLLAPDGDLDINTLSAQNTLLNAVNGDITASSLNVSGNLNMFAQADDSGISVDNAVAGLLSAEAGNDISINSNQGLEIESMLSRNGSIDLSAEGNTYIREIAAANDISILVNDEQLTVVNLGRVERNQDIIPSTVNLTVTDAKNPSENKNSKLDIYNGYAKDKVTLKADTITAQVYDISDSSQKGDIRHDSKYGIEATGFHNANQNGDLLAFDIQGANYEQKDAGSNPHNPNYHPDENDKHALSVHLTMGDSVGDAAYGANFEKLYSDYAFIDSVNKADPSAYSNLVVGSGIIGDYAIFRNNKYRLDINNNDAAEETVKAYPINKHYDDEPDRTVTNTTSFNAQIFDSIIIDNPYNPSYPVDPVTGQVYNPHRNVKEPNLAQKTKQLSAKDSGNSAVNPDASTGLKQINWVVRNTNDDILGASDNETLHNPVVNSMLAISQKGVIVNADTSSENGLKQGQKLRIDLKYKDIGFTVDGVVNEINGRNVEIDFVNVDKLTSTVMLFLTMYQEDL